MGNTNQIRLLVYIALLLAFVVIGLGAYTRLTHAGLGCPDWPGCYGSLVVPQTTAELAAAQANFPELLIEPKKAWNEMVHRYFASGLGLLIFIIALLSFKNRAHGTPIVLPILIAILVVFQGLLGMWTVTMKLMPVVVLGHLVGGFSILALLFLLSLRLNPYHVPEGDIRLRKYTKYAFLGIIILLGQIMLGAWTSSNYAALSCTELPICQSGWAEQLTFERSFELIPPTRNSYEYGYLDHASRVTIHVMHRIGAIVTALYLYIFAFKVFRRAQSSFFKNAAMSLAFILTSQLLLGISNVWFSLPLSVAVCHNLVAACLLLSLITLTYSLRRKL